MINFKTIHCLFSQNENLRLNTLLHGTLQLHILLQMRILEKGKYYAPEVAYNADAYNDHVLPFRDFTRLLFPFFTFRFNVLFDNDLKKTTILG